MAGRYDKYLQPGAAPAAPSPPISDSPEPPPNRFGKYLRPPGEPAAPPPGGIDWSRMNQPRGEAFATTPSYSETARDLAQRGFMAAGADPYNARKLSDIAVTGASMHPYVGAAAGIADLTHHFPKGEFSKSAWDVLGIIPGALKAKRAMQGMPQVPMADTPKGINDPAWQPAREKTFPNLPFGLQRQPRMGPGGIPGEPPRITPHDENLAFGRAAYARTRTNPTLYAPESMEDYIRSTMQALARPHGVNNTTHIPENSPEYYALMERWYHRAQQYQQRGQPVTAEIWDQFRQELNSLQGHSGSAGGKSADLLDRYMVDPPPGMQIGGTAEDLERLRSDFAIGRPSWRAGKTAETIESDLTSSQSSAVGALQDPGEASRRTMDYYANKAGADAIFGARPDERAVIREAAEGSRGRRIADALSQNLGGGWAATIGGILGGGVGGGTGFAVGGAPGAGIGTAIGTAAMGIPKVVSKAVGSAVSGSKTRAAEEAIANIRRHGPLYEARSNYPPEPDYSPGRPVPPQGIPGQRQLPPPPSREVVPEMPPLAAQGGWRPPEQPPTPIPYAPPYGAPPIDDPRAQLRDSVAYALLPQARQSGENVWDQFDRPFTEGIQGSPGPTAADQMPSRVVDTPRGPIRIYVNEPEDWQPER